MGLEFNKLTEQLRKMGDMIQALDFDLNAKLRLGLERFRAADDLARVYDYIEMVRQSDISGYRGAAPLPPPYGQPVNQVTPAPPVPPVATLIAADGSQVYPDEQAMVHYYLLNTGLFIYHHGMPDHLPEGHTLPRLFYHKSHVHDSSNRLISNRTVDARRTVQEITDLAQTARQLRRQGAPEPLIALYDNHLLFWVNDDVTDSDSITQDYMAALIQLHDAGAALGGYLDSPPRSRLLIRLLFLLSLPDVDAIKRSQSALSFGGDLEGLRDTLLLDRILKPGERTAVMVQNSPQNLQYRQRGVSYEIAFFYVKVFNGYQTAIARVDLPMWVARDPAQVDALHALIVQQSQMQGRTPYPYALIRADELALVDGRDKRKLDELVTLELRRKGLAPELARAKNRSKDAARSDKRGYALHQDLSGSHHKGDLP